MAETERRPLTVEVVKAQRPRAVEYIVWDSKLLGFGLRVRPFGGKVYMLRMRVDGRQRWYTIGRHGAPWTPDTARDEAARVLGQAANVRKLRETGQAPATLRHPIEARELRKATPTLREFANRYIEEYATPHKAPASAAADRANLDRAIVPYRETNSGPTLGDLRVTAITRAEVTRFHLSRKDTPTNANRCLALLSHMMGMAEKWGVRPEGSNPCRYVKRFPETKRERFLSGEELARLGAALTKLAKGDKVTPFGLAAVRLLIFTGARASEVLGLKWEGVSLEAGAVRIASKTGPRSLMLNPPAAAVLAGLPRVKGNPFVIVGAGKRRKKGESKPAKPTKREPAALTLSGLEQVWQEVRKAAGLEDVRLHDLRHSFASVAAAGGASLPIIGALLGHSQAQTTKRYAHLAAAPLQAASGAVAATIAAAMEGKRPKRDNVTAMRGRR